MTQRLGRVFVVDDEPELVTALCEILDAQGYEVKCFTSAEEALKALPSEDVDVLVSDVMMPEMDGLSLLKAALKIDPNLIGIMMTGHGTIQTAVEAMKSGAFDYVLKPFKLAELTPVLSRAMEVRRLRLENVQLRETVAIYQLTKALAFSLDLNTVLNKVADAAVEQCEADESSVMLLTNEGDYLYVAAVAGKERKAVLGERVQIGQGIAGWVAMKREPLVLGGKDDPPWFSRLRMRPEIRSSISVPMLVGGKVVGVLNVNDTHSSRPFPLGKAKALSILAGIAATAIEAAELFTRVKQAESKYRTLVEQLPAITYVVSYNGGYRPLYVSPQIQDVLGISADEWMQNPGAWKDHIHHEDRARVLDEITKCHSCRHRFVSEYRMVTPDNRTVWLHDEALPLACEKDQPVVLQGVMVDVTHLKEAESALKASEAMNRFLIEESPLGIGIAQRGQLIYANPALTDMFGYESTDKMVGLSLEDLVAPDQSDVVHLKPADRLAGKPFSQHSEIQGMKSNGQRFDLEAWPKPISYHAEPAILFFAADTTESKNLRAQLLQAQKLEAVGTLAGGVAHDFNNLLTVILGFSDLLLSEKSPDDPEYDDLMKLSHAASSGAELVRRMLTFTRRVESNPVTMNLNNQILDLKQLFARAIPKMIDIRLDLSDDLAEIHADRPQMEQVLMNLVVNARDAMPDGGELLIQTKNVSLDKEYCRMRLECKSGNHVLLSVADTGQGMEPETLNRIFEPFFTTKQPGEGTGLGLATVYGIVKQHKGFVECSSERDRGTTFNVYLPALEEQAEPAEVGVEELKPTGGTETILLVEDEEVIRDLGIKLLGRAGYTVLTASDGYEALEIYRNRGSDVSLILLDLVMHGMGGQQCLEELLKIDSDAKVVISSGYAHEGSTKRMIELGAKDFVTKPYTAGALLKTVRTVLDSDDENEANPNTSAVSSAVPELLQNAPH